MNEHVLYELNQLYVSYMIYTKKLIITDIQILSTLSTTFTEKQYAIWLNNILYENVLLHMGNLIEFLIDEDKADQDLIVFLERITNQVTTLKLNKRPTSDEDKIQPKEMDEVFSILKTISETDYGVKFPS